MTSKAALCMALLRGEVVTIMTGFKYYGISNVPREISRGVEQPFNVLVTRTRKEGKSRYNVPVTWVEYRLNRVDYNLPGIELMKAYVKEQMASRELPKTDAEAKIYKQTNLWLESL